MNVEIDFTKSEKEILAFVKGIIKENKNTYNWKDIDSYELAVVAKPVQEEDTLYETDSKRDRATKMMRHIIYVINGDWTPDYSDSSQRKWIPFFNLSFGCRFDFSDCECALSYAVGGVRLCFESEEKSNFAGKTFEPLYADILT